VVEVNESGAGTIEVGRSVDEEPVRPYIPSWVTLSRGLVVMLGHVKSAFLHTQARCATKSLDMDFEAESCVLLNKFACITCILIVILQLNIVVFL
jgi:hypothetical protein